MYLLMLSDHVCAVCRRCLTFAGSSGDMMLQSASRLVDSWQRRRPDLLLDPPAVWDDVVTNRLVTNHSLNQPLRICS